jgi:hypothetical protein
MYLSLNYTVYMKGEKFAKTLLLLGCPQRPTTAYNIDTKRLRIRPYITRSNGKRREKNLAKEPYHKSYVIFETSRVS